MNQSSSSVGKLSFSSYNFLDSFVNQTQLQVVVRLMHFYDTVEAARKEKAPVDIIIQVLTDVFETKCDEHELKKTMSDLGIDPESKILTRQKIRLVFKECLQKEMCKLDKNRLRKHFKHYDFEDSGIITKKKVKQMLKEADCKLKNIHILIKKEFHYEQKLNEIISRKEQKHRTVRDKEKEQRQYESVQESPPPPFEIVKKIGLAIIFVLLLQVLLPFFLFLCFVATFIDNNTIT